MSALHGAEVDKIALSSIKPDDLKEGCFQENAADPSFVAKLVCNPGELDECFIHESSGRRRRTVGAVQTNAPAYCIRACKAAGYAYAALGSGDRGTTPHGPTFATFCRCGNRCSP